LGNHPFREESYVYGNDYTLGSLLRCLLQMTKKLGLLNFKNLANPMENIALII
ncbi:MAG: hypothetical protein ACI9XB_001186, partial [Gammaproteobacteria bacterium]